MVRRRAVSCLPEQLRQHGDGEIAHPDARQGIDVGVRRNISFAGDARALEAGFLDQSDAFGVGIAEVGEDDLDRLAVLGCGGVDDAASARAMLDAGADLVRLYRGLIYRGPLLPGRMTRGLKKMAGKKDFA